VLASFHKEYPLVRATCLVSPQSESLQMLSEGKAHLALASNPPFLQDIEFHQITTEKIVLIAPKNHPWAQQGAINVDELHSGHFILPEEGSEVFASVREALADLGCSLYQLDTLICLGSLEAIALSVQECLGVGFVPELLVHRLVPQGVAIIPINGACIQREVYIGRNQRRPATAAQQAFWELLVSTTPTFWKSLQGKKPRTDSLVKQRPDAFRAEEVTPSD
jgi:DNA-binding transcriptional LysR family regulator